ncbi:MAG: GTP cyclohydrolase I [Planctomycetota bacterium]|jgi:hypothetical protein
MIAESCTAAETGRRDRREQEPLADPPAFDGARIERAVCEILMAIADALVTHLQPEGVMVVVEAEHLCMTVRGAKSSDARMTTMARRGVLRSDATLSAQVLSMITGLHAA